jgi:PAS domain S-box-containing protein
MKKELQSLYVLLLLNCVAALSLPAVGIKISSAIFVLAALILSLFILHRWMSYTKELILKSNLVINKKESISTWTFSNIDLLKRNQELVEEKFIASAELISNLGNPEKMDTIKNLDTNDPIGKAIQFIKAEMQRVKEIDEHREWIAQGLASFSEVLRNKSEVKDYGHHIISTLVKYLKANQGALFIEYQGSENERYLELLANYAYDKRKFVEAKILEGEGLIGQCMLEQDYIFITNVPPDYVKINSGLGAATPKAIVVAPLVFNRKFYGAIELASFEMLQPYQIEFLKKVCEIIASEISALKNIERTKSLLDESTLMAKELQSREVEMKQNMEELTATQEEMAKNQIELSNKIKEAERSQRELKSYLSGIDNTIASVEFGLDGKFKDANEIFLKVSGYTKHELLNKDYTFLMGEDQTITIMWENLLLGKFFSGEFKMKSKIGKELWLNGTFNPITIEGNVPEKIMMFVQFTTQEKEKLNDLTAMVHALKATLPVIEFNKDFACKIANEMALQLFGLSRLQLRSKTIFDFIAPCYHEAWKDRRNEIFRDDLSNFVIPFNSKLQILNYEVNVSVSRNLEGEITKIIFLLIRVVANNVSLLAVG